MSRREEFIAAIYSTPWEEYSHAYGVALDVKNNLIRLLSEDQKEFEEAEWNLSSTIYHQGDIFDSTAASIRFLCDLAFEFGKTELIHLLKVIADSSAITSDDIRLRWKKQFEKWPNFFDESEKDKADEQIRCTVLVHKALLAEAERIQKFVSVQEGETRDAGQSILRVLKQET